jgi:pSer/pThr/pTyr-binding forkhead associated (FHA) protein
VAAATVPGLTFLHGDQSGETIALAADGSWIAGRSAEADIVIRDDTVSRKHIRIFHARDGVWLRDLGSRNGTQVNGRRVDRHRLSEGDRITVGANLLRYERTAAAKSDRKVRAEDSSGRSMSGSVQDIPLADVLQWLATSRKTGTLKVEGSREGQLFLRDGMVFSATIDGAKGLHPEKALLRMLAWDDGLFELDSHLPEDLETEEIAPSLNQVLMEAARQADELAHLAESNAVPDQLVELAFPPETAWKELEPEELDLVQELASGKDWQKVLDSSRDSDVDLTRRVIKLHQKGVVRFEPESD